jgi:multidrug resistance efflux pump
MTRAVALPTVMLLATVMATLAVDQLPRNQSQEPDAFDIEPPILKQNLSNEPSSLTPAPDGDVAHLEKQLERAKRNAAGAERLCKIGVLAKVEVEQRLLRVVRCECDLANARLARSKEEVAAQESRIASGENAKDELETAKAALAQLTEAAQIAAAKRERAELDAAEANLRRQEKLMKLGIAQKSDVTDAQEKLAELKAQKK